MASFSFGTEKVIGSGLHPAIAAGQDGNLHVVYMNSTRTAIKYRSYNPTSGAVGIEETVFVGEAWAPQITVSSDNEIHIAWEKNITATSGYIGYARKIAGVWKSIGNLHTDKNLTGALSRAMIPRIAVDGSGRAHIVFWKNTGEGLPSSTMARGQYNRIDKVNGVLVNAIRKEITGWDGSRYGDIVFGNDSKIHVFAALSQSVLHWTVSDTGVFTASTPLNRPSDPAIEKLMEGISVSTGAGGDFYGYTKDAGDPVLNPVKEFIHTRASGLTKIISDIYAPAHLALKSIGDLSITGRSYCIFTGSDNKARIVAVDLDGTVTTPVLVSASSLQNEGTDRHTPGGCSKVSSGVHIVYQDNRSGSWQIITNKVNLSSAPVVSLAPKQSEWVEKGRVINAGPPGSWDAYFGGSLTPCSMIKKNGTYFLYYIGGTERRSPTDGEGKYRSLGVATSQDGIHFTKYSKNPILVHKSANAAINPDEEGIFSAAAMLDDNGDVIIYYAAMNATSPLDVDSSINMAVSSNGYDFSGIRVVADARTSGIWGYGDELFPIGALKTNGKYYVYYIAKGYNKIMWDIGIGSGILKDHFDTSQALLQLPTIEGSAANDYAAGNPAIIKGSNIISFLELGRTGKIELRSSSLSNPLSIGPVMDNYQFTYPGGSVHHAMFYDPAKNMWLMYYRDRTVGINARTVNYQEMKKYKCSGAPFYQCTEDPAGTYDTLAACNAACILQKPVLNKILVSPAMGSIVVGDILTVIGTAIDSNGNSLGGIPIVWTSDPAGIVEIDPVNTATFIDGKISTKIKGILPGMCIIKGTSGSISGQLILDVNVAPPPPPPPPSIKWKCSGSPDYSCVEDPTGTFNSLTECQAVCKDQTKDDEKVVLAVIAALSFLR